MCSEKPNVFETDRHVRDQKMLIVLASGETVPDDGECSEGVQVVDGQTTIEQTWRQSRGTQGFGKRGVGADRTRLEQTVAVQESCDDNDICEHCKWKAAGRV